MTLGGNAAAWAATTLQKIRKNIKSSIEQDATLMTKLQKLPKEYVSSDQNIRVPLKVTYPGKYAAMDFDGGVFGDGGGVQTIQGTATTVARRHALALNLQPIFNTNSGEKAIANALVKQTADGLPEFLAMLEREFQTTGNLVLATLTTVAGAPDYTCTGSDFGIQLLRKGMDIQVYLATNPYTIRAGGPYEITKYQPFTGPTFTTSASITGATIADVVCLYGQTYDSTVKGLMGIPAGNNYATTGTYLTIDRANYPEARTPVYDFNSGGLSLYGIRLGLNRMRIKRGISALASANPVVYINPAQVAAYEDLIMTYTDINRSTGAASAPDALLPYGNGSIGKFEGFPVLESINAPKNRIDLLELNDWFLAETVPIDFFDFPDTGKPVRIAVDGTTGTPKARLLWYLFFQGQLVNANPGNGCAFPNLALGTGY